MADRLAYDRLGPYITGALVAMALFAVGVAFVAFMPKRIYLPPIEIISIDSTDNICNSHYDSASITMRMARPTVANIEIVYVNRDNALADTPEESDVSISREYNKVAVVQDAFRWPVPDRLVSGLYDRHISVASDEIESAPVFATSAVRVYAHEDCPQVCPPDCRFHQDSP